MRKPTSYSGYSEKDDLRQALVREQRGLCCYCLGRIDATPTLMKIEHWRSQSRYPTEQLTYRNLLGACLGGDGQPRGQQHCDTRKGNRDLRWNPAEPDHSIEARITFDLDGTIRSNDSEFDRQLNDVLNLNHPVLKNHRKKALDGLIDGLRLRKHLTKDKIEREIKRLIGGDGHLAPYCQLPVWWLQRKLARRS
jgi:uncharacterized protein (TIGR02646 family)